MPGAARRAGEHPQGRQRRIAELQPARSRRWAHPNLGAIERVRAGQRRAYTYLTEQRGRRGAGQGASCWASSTSITERDDGDLRRAVPADERELPARPFWSCSAAARRGWSWRTRTTSSTAASRSRCSRPARQLKTHHAALRRREGVRGHRAVLRHSEGAAHALLRHGRDRGRAGRAPTWCATPATCGASPDKTQFIVITHRRGTMEEADVLYGVTMQEQGVSRILTINLNDMAKELHIK